MKGRTLAVLMWKHLMVRKKRFIQTPLEYLSPIFFFVILYLCMDNQMMPQGISDSPIRHTDILPLSESPTPRRVFYHPDTNLTRLIMAEVGNKINLPKFEGVPGHRGKFYSSVQNLSNFATYIDKFTTDEALIVFKNMEVDTWPKLSYSIRMKTPLFHIESFKIIEHSFAPQSQFGVVYEEFVLLQWAIDTAYISLLSGYNITQDVTLQEFPYYGRDLSSKMGFICQFCLICSWLAFILYFVFLMSRLLEERVTGVQELTKMVGVTTNTLNLSHFLNVLPCGLIYAIVVPCLLTLPKAPLIPNSSTFMMVIILFLQFLSITAMAFACSYFTDTTQYSVSIAVFMYILLCVPAIAVSKFELSHNIMLIAGLLPSTPIYWYWHEVQSLEMFEYGLTWSEAWRSHSTTSGPYMLAALYLLIQTIFFFAFSFYLGCVRPGKYGQALPWNFLFEKQYWSKVEPDIDSFEETPMVREEKYFERPVKNTEVGIKIVNVSKTYPKQKALSNVDLEIYKGEITVLLGHNGAGKTTLMSIITGMISPSQGKVYINGLDISRHRDDVRKSIGFCPQHNLFFPDLNVLEHVIFFSMLKTGTYSEAKSSALKQLEQVGLSAQAQSSCTALSGGMKRRAQLACALGGGGTLLALDEPTAGLDLHTRRQLWDLLLSLRGGRTVVLSTHLLEEAEALADRAAALHRGRLTCHATTMHLKRAMGTGYRLSLTTNGEPRDDAISTMVISHIPEASITQKTFNSITFSLPASSSNKFPALFTSLEDHKIELGIENVGVGISTLEEVFLKLCSDSDYVIGDDEIDSRRIEPEFNKVTGLKLYWRQFIILSKRQFHFIWAKKFYFLIMQIIIPIFLITSFTSVTSVENIKAEKTELLIDLNMYSHIEEQKVLYNVNATGVNVELYKQKHPNVQFVQSYDVYNDVLNTAKNNIMDYNKYLVGVELNDTNGKVMYTTVYRHAAPTAMNFLTNLIASQYLPNNDGHIITTYNSPFDDSASLGNEQVLQPKSLDRAITWTMLIIFVLTTTLISLMSLPCQERLSGTRHIHIMAGCPPVVHFGTTLLFHMTLTTYTIILSVLLNCYYNEIDHTIDQLDFMFCMFVILFVSSLSFLSLSYFVSFIFGELGTGIVLFASLIVFGIITPIYQTLQSMNTDSNMFGVAFNKFVEFVMPPHTITVSAVKCINVARMNALCDLNVDKCPNIPVAEHGFDIVRCCAGLNPRCYFCWDDHAPLKPIIILCGQFIFYMTLVIMCQKGVFARLMERINNAHYKRPPPVEQDEIVRAEKVFVEKEIGLDPKTIKDANISLLVNDVHKNYNRLFRSCNAVKGISFSVKQGECFGLLGVNGAGKTTTFKMLTAEEYPTRGEIFGNGYRMNKEPAKYLRNIGYCPQFFGLDEFLSGIDNLKVLLTLRGLDSEQVDSEADTWIKLVGLEKYSSRCVSSYSGGMSRRLCGAGALCCGNAVAVLDEPTAGVDVRVRRRLWAALRAHNTARRGTLIASHSLEEVEALCGRVALLARGALRALGSPAELRARHARGHALRVKLTHRDPRSPDGDGARSSMTTPDRSNDINVTETDSHQTPTMSANVNNLKRTLQTKFNCTLKDEHKTMLHYHINETMRNSDLFKELEELKTMFPHIIEDYTVSETTLEEVFLSFAKEASEEQENESNHIV